jgi:hypothetical protein
VIENNNNNNERDTNMTKITTKTKIERVSLEALRELRKCSFCQHLVFAANSLKSATPWDIEVYSDKGALDLYYEVEVLGVDKRTGETFKQYKNEHTSARCRAVIKAALARA